MKNLAFIVTTLSLGTMVGISGSHYFQVKAMVAEHEKSVEQYVLPVSNVTAVVDNEVITPIDSEKSTTTVTDNDPEAVATNIAVKPLPAETQSQGNNSQQAVLIEILEAMRIEQHAMRKQLAETNRDLAEANFRLDTHSDSFKPLRVDSESPRSFGGRARELDSNESNSLLPPK